MKFANIPGKLTTLIIVLAVVMPSWLVLATVKFAKVYAEDAPLTPESQIFAADSHQGTAPMKVGDIFHIVLEANPSTGYCWQVEGLDTSILQQGDVTYRPTSDLLGAPEEQIISFTALRGGQTALDLRYKRPWENETRLETRTLWEDEGRLQNFTMNVTVTE